MEEKHIPNSEQPMKMQMTDPNKVICIDCAFRDKTTLELSGKVVPIGVTRCYCKIYPEKSSIGKPIPILICGADCEYYTKDEGESIVLFFITGSTFAQKKAWQQTVA